MENINSPECLENGGLQVSWHFLLLLADQENLKPFVPIAMIIKIVFFPASAVTVNWACLVLSLMIQILIVLKSPFYGYELLVFIATNIDYGGD